MQANGRSRHIPAGVNTDPQNLTTPLITRIGTEDVHPSSGNGENLSPVGQEVMVLTQPTPTDTRSDQEQRDLLLQLDDAISRVVLSRQHPITGLLPASTAHTVHGNYGDAWVRDCVYSIQCVWGLALAHRRHCRPNHTPAPGNWSSASSP